MLITVGISGAWIGNLVALEPYRPLFIAVALLALFFAWCRIFRSVKQCQSSELCAVPAVRTGYSDGQRRLSLPKPSDADRQ
ncbi:mercuric transporter MerT family protein [Halomonas cerina]|uniref:mercuric transporter MerT family protein n=1 Tax=Halomonas cerina TaxID=447424 RepID=UPI003CCD836E